MRRSRRRGRGGRRREREKEGKGGGGGKGGGKGGGGALGFTVAQHDFETGVCTSWADITTYWASSFVPAAPCCPCSWMSRSCTFAFTRFDSSTSRTYSVALFAQ